MEKVIKTKDANKKNEKQKTQVFVEYKFTKLPFAKLDKQSLLILSTVIKNLKDQKDNVLTITASELSAITGIKDKPRIHKKLFEITENFKEINTIDFVGYGGFISLFDTFIFSEKYSPNFDLKVRLSEAFRQLVNGLGQPSIRYFDYDISTMRLLPSRSFDSLLYIFLSSQSIKSKNGVLITKDDLINKMGVPLSKIEEGHIGGILTKALNELVKQGILKNVRTVRIKQGEYKIYYELIKANKTLFDFEN